MSMKTGMTAWLLVGAFVGFGTSAAAATMTLKGTVTDAMCGAKHTIADAVACTKACVKKGSDYGLVATDGKVYTLKADSTAKSELDGLAGKTAQVSGEVSGTTLTVSSVKSAK